MCNALPTGTIFGQAYIAFVWCVLAIPRESTLCAAYVIVRDSNEDVRAVTYKFLYSNAVIGGKSKLFALCRSIVCVVLTF